MLVDISQGYFLFHSCDAQPFARCPRMLHALALLPGGVAAEAGHMCCDDALYVLAGRDNRRTRLDQFVMDENRRYIHVLSCFAECLLKMFCLTLVLSDVLIMTIYLALSCFTVNHCEYTSLLLRQTF